MLLDEGDDLGQALAGLHIAEDEWSLAAHASAVAIHDLQRGTDQWCEIGLVDHQEVGPGNPWPSLARDFVAGSDVDDVDRQIGKLRAEGRREVVTPRFHEHDLDVRESRRQAGDKWRLYVPSELAYGPEGFGPVPPNAVLVFELELLEIAAPAAATPVGQGTLPRQIK